MTLAAPPLRLFGAPLLQPPAAPALVFRREQRFRVLGYLAASETPVDRDALAAVFWPDEPNDVARRNLRKTLFDLRQLVPLADASGWHADSQTVGWQVDSDLARMRQALAAGDLRAAATWYGGALLQGLDGGATPFRDWLDAERERHAQRWRTLALDWLDQVPGDADDLTWSTRLLASDPLDERAMRAQVRALVRRGQITTAQRCHARWRARMRDELGLPTTDDFATLAAGPANAGNAVAGAAARSTDAPRYLTAFIGRAHELARLRTLLTGPHRLVTLVGPPGSGKTRLAAEAFASLRGRLALRLVFVELERLPAGGGDGALVREVAQALGLALADSDLSLERLAAEVDREPTLILLDNFEHRLADLPVLVRLLRQHATRLLVTSRVRLDLDAEGVLALDGLAVEPGAPDHPTGSDALRLFEARCRPLAEGERADALALCRLLEGQPLAIELAARACRAFAPAELRMRLQDGFEALSSTACELPARQRSLRAAFDTSWQLLAPAQQDALMSLAVMPAGFSAASARAVAGVDDGVVGTLVDHSLLRLDPVAARLRWHPFVHRFAFDALAARPARLRALREEQLRHFVGQLRRLDASDRHPSRAALRYLAVEVDNLVAAWRHACALGDAPAQRVLAEALALHHEFHARCDDGAALLEASTEPAVQLLRARLLHWGAPQRADAIAHAAEQALAAGSDVAWQIEAARVLGLVAWRRGDASAAARRFGDAIALADDPHFDAQRAILLDGLGLALAELGERARARAAFGAALALNEANGNELQAVQNLINLALDARRDDPARAGALAQRALALAREIGFVHYEPHAWITLALARAAAGRGAAALQAAGHALAGARRSGDRYAESWAGVALAEAARAAGDEAGARAATHDGLALAWRIGDLALVRQHLAVRDADAVFAGGSAPADARPICERVHEALGHLGTPLD